ncbi:MAG: type II toxin-antitoxin system RelE/ParE family toxin [Selenomonadaceae bacterium]|nr:type II toxin-antitoxin system RelE/ParE family toxin [Selenomonadaceae bacterium]
MSYQVKLTDTAKQDLREIALWLAERSSDIKAAKTFVSALQAKCKKLDAFPESGAFPKDRVLRSAGYRFIVHDDYLIFYKIDDAAKVVNVMAIFNGKKDYMRVMRKFI